MKPLPKTEVRMVGPNLDGDNTRALALDAEIKELMDKHGAKAYIASFDNGDILGCAMSGNQTTINDCLAVSVSGAYNMNPGMSSMWYDVEDPVQAGVVHPYEFTDLDQIKSIFPARIRLNPDAMIRNTKADTMGHEIASIISIKLVLAMVYEACVSETLNEIRFRPELKDTDCDCPACSKILATLESRYMFVGQYSTWLAQLAQDLSNRAYGSESTDVVGRCALTASLDVTANLMRHSVTIAKILCEVAAGSSKMSALMIGADDPNALIATKDYINSPEDAMSALSSLFSTRKEAELALEVLKKKPNERS